MARGLGQALSKRTNGDSSVRVLRAGETSFDIAMRTVPIAHGTSRPQTNNVVSMLGDKRAVAKRLRAARQGAGYASGYEFANTHGFNPTTYYHHENGRRGVPADAARQYAAILGMPAGTLLYGESLQPVVRIPIVGEIATDGKIVLQSDSAAPSCVELPDFKTFVALTVMGNDLYPCYRHGDMIFHRRLTPEQGFPILDLHNCECVVELEDGRVLLRVVMVEPDGRATLVAYHAPAEVNQQIVAACPVEFVRRALPEKLRID